MTGRLQVPAPHAEREMLWSLSPERFNEWRSMNDFPRIVQYFKSRLGRFTEWQQETGVTDADLVAYGPARFIGLESSVQFIHFSFEGKISYKIQFNSLQDDDTPRWDPTILYVKTVPSYLSWAHVRRIRVHPDVPGYDFKAITMYLEDEQRIRAFLFAELELLFLGSCSLPPMFMLGGRNLEFTCIDRLEVGDVWNSGPVLLWYCSARNLTIKSSLQSVDGYMTNFDNLRIQSSRLQRWRLLRCHIADAVISDSVLSRWKVHNTSLLQPIFTDTDLDDCSFSRTVRHSGDVAEAASLFNIIKRVYSSKGRYKEAGDYYYLEQCFRRRMALSPLTYSPRLWVRRRTFIGTYWDAWIGYKDGMFDRSMAVSSSVTLFFDHIFILINPLNWPILIGQWLTYTASLIQWLWWGYGERPSRVLGVSLVTILVVAAGFYVWGVEGATGTKTDLPASLYYSVFTFAVGYGEIDQTSRLRLLSGLAALLGVLNTGLLIAGFSSKAKY